MSNIMYVDPLFEKFVKDRKRALERQLALNLQVENNKKIITQALITKMIAEQLKSEPMRLNLRGKRITLI